METLEQAREKISTELRSGDEAVRREFLGHFDTEIAEFESAMARAVMEWRAFDSAVESDEEKALVSAIIYAALMLSVQSMKLFISGHIVPAGALMRQVVEAIAMALLCSKRELGVLKRFSNSKYSVNDAVTHVGRRAKQVGLFPSGLASLKQAQSFYHKYSHISFLTIAAGISMNGGGIYVGASFDEAKLDAYRKEVAGRVSLAQVFDNFVKGVAQNVAKWNEQSGR